MLATWRIVSVGLLRAATHKSLILFFLELVRDIVILAVFISNPRNATTCVGKNTDFFGGI